ncbi:hypothetical protein [Paraferrimonas haliotis]|uniref:Uncharacterized protein n=1 Tax=Paraferrimonas haliotis TaxID=2013866 RepID=A0AA37WWA5_9GAMM|nr:hypothetical protein [Paraferrimonas haliotis]GLS83237.1 hypothetical protein GCM10007894_12140 [Paraferrimonas haliotis]
MALPKECGNWLSESIDSVTYLYSTIREDNQFVAFAVVFMFILLLFHAVSAFKNNAVTSKLVGSLKSGKNDV